MIEGEDTDYMSLLLLVTSIGKSLIKKGILESDEIVQELELLAASIGADSATNKLFRLELSNTIRAVSDW